MHRPHKDNTSLTQMNNNTESPPKSVAAIDLGSNSFHMKIAHVFDNELKVVDRLRESVQLAAGLDAKQHIDSEAQERAIACLSRFGERLREVPSGSIRAVGTNTLRKARNSGELIDAMEQALGHPIEIISGIEEARLIYLGVAHSLAADRNRRLVMDIGGGSTELIIGEGFVPIRTESLYMGCISMTRKYFTDGAITRKAWKRAILAAEMELVPIEAEYRKLGWEVAIGASGTIRAVAKIINKVSGSDEITLEALQDLAGYVLNIGYISKLGITSGLSDERIQTLPGGLAVLLATFHSLGIKSMRISDGALREGLLYNQLKRIRHEDVRSSSIKALASHYRVDDQQAQRVIVTALSFFDQVAKAWGLEDENWSELLAWAGQVYEIGIAIAHSQHQKHAAYIIEHADLAGFSHQEQKQLAILIQAHRRKLPLAAFREFPAPQSKPLLRLAILLRLSVLLHRSRSPDKLPEIILNVQKKNIQLHFPENWLDEHALSQADLTQEAEMLAEADYVLEFD